jgi:hypothetical protein
MVVFSLNIRVGGETLAGALDGRLGNVGADVRRGFTYGSPTGNGVEEGMPFSIDMKGLRPTRIHTPLDCFAAKTIHTSKNYFFRLNMVSLNLGKLNLNSLNPNRGSIPVRVTGNYFFLTYSLLFSYLFFSYSLKNFIYETESYEHLSAWGNAGVALYSANSFITGFIITSFFSVLNFLNSLSKKRL